LTKIALGKVNRQVWIIYLSINLALTISFALPGAGMINHLIPIGEMTFARGMLIWAILSILCMILTLPFIPAINHRITPSSR
jgi:hypothetical protein